MVTRERMFVLPYSIWDFIGVIVFSVCLLLSVLSLLLGLLLGMYVFNACVVTREVDVVNCGLYNMNWNVL